MYLSKIHVPWDQAKDPYYLHKALWKLFPDRPDDKRDFLFRVEKIQLGVGVDVLMQSIHKPLPNEASPALVAYREYPLVIRNEQQLRFRLRANPIKTIKDESKGKKERNGHMYTKTVRVPLVTEEQQLDWLHKKLAGIATLDTVIVQKEIPLYFHKGKANISGKIQTICFDGTLTVRDSNAFMELIKQGIGPAKSFGCGLISLAPT